MGEEEEKEGREGDILRIREDSVAGRARVNKRPSAVMAASATSDAFRWLFRPRLSRCGSEILFSATSFLPLPETRNVSAEAITALPFPNFRSCTRNEATHPRWVIRRSGSLCTAF